MIIKERMVAGIHILDLEGSIRLGEEESQLRQAVKNLSAAGQTNLLLNLQAVDYIDSSGLGALVYGFTSLQRQGGRLKLLNVREKVRDILKLTRLLSVFETYEDEVEAVESFV